MTDHMTLEGVFPQLIKISRKFLTGDTEISKRNLLILSKLINKGYNIPRYKYNVVRSSRIKHPERFLDDLGFTKKGSYLYLLIVPVAFFATYQLKNSQARKQWWNEEDAQKIEIVTADEGFEYTEEMISRTLGTIGIKPVSEYKIMSGITTLEVTAFTSHFPYAGTFMFKLLIKNLNEMSQRLFEPAASGVIGSEVLALKENSSVYEKVGRLLAVVIVEHELVEYYVNKLGFTELKREKVPLLTDNSVSSPDLESGIIASRDFHLATLYKDL